MDSYNIEEYITKFNPSKIEFKIFEVLDANNRHYFVKFLKEIDRPFRRHKQVWSTLCYASGHSHGYDWHTQKFNSVEEAENEINRLVTITKVNEVIHFVKGVK